jgi:hypothetical protein
MRLLALLAPLLVALALAPAAQARAARAVLVTCDRAHQAAVFAGRMDAVDGSARMQMRFRLHAQQPGGGGWRRLSVPGFGAWVTSAPRHSRYVFTRRVEALLAPASYRVQIRFRWLDSAGAVVAEARATSRACRQPDPRPDLAVTAIDVRPAVGGARRYAVTVRNAGRGAAEASELALGLAGGPPLIAAVPALAPGEREVVVVSGPACAAGTPVSATADAADDVDERDEDANVLTVTCPGW